MMRNNLLILLTLCFFCSYKAQVPPSRTGESSTLPNIVPPSPTAYALGNYGNVPVGLFTGSPNISVPLFTYNTKNISVPLNLFYGSNGIKVDEVSTNVGLGWSLNFGGVISIMVRDKPDGTSVPLIYPEDLSGGHSNPTAIQFFHDLGNRDGIASNTDAETDIYSFNFNGISGKFFFDKYNQPHLYDQQDIKIEKANGFILTLANGVKYYFSDFESTKLMRQGMMPAQSFYKGTAIYLSKIVHPNGDEVYFTYEDVQMDYVNSQSQKLIMTLGYPGMQESCGTSGFAMAPTMEDPLPSDNNFFLKTKRIKTIKSNNSLDGSILFTYSGDSNNIDVANNYKIQDISQLDQHGNIMEKISFNYLNTIYKRNFLTSVVFKDPNKSYLFDYESPTGVPERLSFSQDHWGYFNGKTNFNLISKNIHDYNLSDFEYGGADREPDPAYSKKGMLKKITYPTKGYTELEYEGNTYWGEKTVYPPVTDRQMIVRNPITGIKKDSMSFTSPIDQRITISGSCFYYNPQNPNSDPTHDPSGDVELITDDTDIHFYQWNSYSGELQVPLGDLGNITAPFYSDENKVYRFYAKAGKTYKLIFSATRNTSFISNISYYATAPQVFDTNLDTGGVRIKSTKDYDSPGTTPKYKRYYYANKDDIGHSSGHAGLNPYYIDITKAQTKCPSDPQFPLQCSVAENTFVNVTSSSFIPMFDTGTNTCLYRYVTVSNGGDNFEKGGESKEFYISRDTPGNTIWGQNNINSVPWSNRGWKNGLEYKMQLLKKNTNSAVPELIQEKINTYEIDNASLVERKNFSARKNFSIECPTMYVNYYYTCTAADITTPNHPCSYNGNTVGSVIQEPIIDNLDIMMYENLSYRHYLKSQTTTDYINGNPVETKTEYFYNNPSHYQLTNQKTIFPDTTSQETEYKYASDFASTDAVASNMVTDNMIGIPLQTEIKENGTPISKTKTAYGKDATTNNLILPISVSSLDLKTNIMEKAITYNQYDNKGNIQQYTLNPDANGNGIPVTIIWGYNQTRPIAKIEGIGYNALMAVSGISALITDLQTKSAADIDDGTELTLLTALDNFRKNTNLSGYQITTYTYNPLIGVTSITPPSGIREVYIYDNANRLQEVREQNTTGNLLKEYQYHYKP